MRIGDAAAAVGVTTRTLRYYEQRGLVTARRTASGQREYGEEDVRRLHAVRELLDSGLTIGDVRRLIDILDALPDRPKAPPVRTGPDSDTCVVPQVAIRRLAELDARIRGLTELRDRLADRLDLRFGVLVAELIGLDVPMSGARTRS
ncbi:MerR family transcriptional regulator [Streptomyces pseudovenezuelae]|uniref:MerR family copper efflux transcriptional regulator n=1 Tax=Streptomyces pseudovenezuelae TaxID=67350 RepID=A0ABT6LDW0_9ACTN|nr:MerR family transcriptional regulator [Streptomyces pseudovenezuelae]MDH6214500.1 MerR family copper efflux transcriptional regulator [Streptomyces pseudovenezuelae]